MKTLLHWLLYALALTPLIVTRSFFFPYITGKSIFIRVMVTLAALGFAWLLTKRMRDSSWRKALGARLWALWGNKTFLFVCGFMVVLVISTIFAVGSFRAFFGDSERAEGLLTLLFVFGAFALMSFLFGKKEWMTFFKLHLFVGVWLFVTELIEFSQGNIRPSAQTGNPIYLAAVFLFIILAAWVILRDEMLKAKEGKGGSTFWKLFSAAMIPLSVLGIFITQTRGVIAGLIASAVIILILLALRGKGQEAGGTSRRKWAGIGLACIVLFGILFVSTSSAGFWKSIPGFDRLSEFTLNDPTLQTRLISLGVSLRAINPVANGAEKFLIGWGLENFSVAYNTYYNPAYFEYEQSWFDRAHNKLMDVLVMNGVIGFIAYMGMWVSLWAGLRKKRSGEFTLPILFFGVAYFVQNLFVFDSIVTYVPFFAFVAFAIWARNEENSGEAAKGQESAHVSSPRPWFAWAWGSLALFFGVAFIAWTWIPYGQMHNYVGFAQRQEPITKEALDNDFHPYTFVQELLRQHFLRNVTAQYSGKENEKQFVLYGVTYVEDVLAHEPYNPRYHIAIGGSYDKLGKQGLTEYFVKAQEEYQKARELAPKRQDISYLIGYNLAFQEKFEEAIAELQRTVALDPKVASSHMYLGVVLMGTQDPGYYAQGLEELLKAEMLGKYRFGTDTNAPQAISVAMRYFYEQKDADRVIRAADALITLIPQQKEEFEAIKKEAENKTWEPSVFE